MRWMVGLLGLACFSSILTAAETEFPYTATVLVDQAPLRCNASANHQPTDKVPREAIVEVYQHAEDGWCAIRPPEGSFSWVPAQYLKMSDQEDVALVTVEGLRAWVGTKLSDEQLACQVRLKKGEQVVVLATRKILSQQGNVSETWYQISPPAGEFRWIKQKYIQPIAKTELKPEPEAEATATSEQAESKDFAAAHSALNLEVTRAMSRNASSERREELLAKCRELHKSALSPRQRGQAQLLVVTMEEFLDLKRRRLQIASAGTPPVAPTSETTAPTPASATPASAVATAEPVVQKAVGEESIYDGRGFLKELETNRPGKQASGGLPPFALTDESGKIIQLVSPTPGLNLRRYVGKEVGLFGKRSRLAPYKQPHVVASRVVTLDRISSKPKPQDILKNLLDR